MDFRVVRIVKKNSVFSLFFKIEFLKFLTTKSIKLIIKFTLFKKSNLESSKIVFANIIGQIKIYIFRQSLFDF